MSRMIGWICYAAVMAWPGAWPSGALASWMLAWAGDYANTPPNACSAAEVSLIPQPNTGPADKNPE